MPELSVLIPARNAEKTLQSAVRSTLRALPRDAEVVVLNDASSDTTSTVIERLETTDRRVRGVHVTANVGVAAGLNKLLAMTDSRWVARMDADDVVLPWRFRMQLSAAHRYRADAVFSCVGKFTSGVRSLRPQLPARVTPEMTPMCLLFENVFAHSTLLASRAAFEEAGGYHRSTAEDYELWMRMTTRGQRLARTSTPAILYRAHAGQLTQDLAWQERTREDALLNRASRDLALQACGVDVELHGVLNSAHAATEQKAAAMTVCDDVARRINTLPHRDRPYMRRILRRATARLASVGGDCR